MCQIVSYGVSCFEPSSFAVLVKTFSKAWTATNDLRFAWDICRRMSDSGTVEEQVPAAFSPARVSELQGFRRKESDIKRRPDVSQSLNNSQPRNTNNATLKRLNCML
jgi:predicted oxidoreductase